MRSVVVDASVFLSLFVERNKAQQGAALRLLAAAEEGQIAGVIPPQVSVVQTVCHPQVIDGADHGACGSPDV